MRRHPLASYVVLTYALSWPLFLAARAGGEGLIMIGAFGPAVAAMILIRRSGTSVRNWWRSLWNWRQPVRFYLYALGLPILIVGVTALELAATGRTIDVGDLSTLLPRHVLTVALVAILGGGQEEPGWRGHALDEAQARYSPMLATMWLAAIWGAWHLPVYGIGGVAGPLLFAVFYTWLFNATRSLPLCMLLHASFNTTIGYLDLANADAVTNVAFVVTAVVSAAVLVVITKGRLGAPQRSPAPAAL